MIRNRFIKNILIASSVLLSFFFFLSYFANETNLFLGFFNCFTGSSNNYINTSHSYHCGVLHQIFPSNADGNYLNIFLQAIIIIYLFLFGLRYFLNEKYDSIKTTLTKPFWIMVIISIVTSLFAIINSNQEWIGIIGDNFVTRNFIESNNLTANPQFYFLSSVRVFIFIFCRTFLKLSLLALFTIIFRNIGKLVFDKFNQNNVNGLQKNIIYIVLGASIYGLLLIIFALFGILTTITNWLILIGFIGISIYGKNSIKEIHKILFTKTFVLKNWLNTFLFITLISWISINILEITRPSPIGWDDMTFYLNYGKNIFETGTLPSGFAMKFWEVFVAQGYFLISTNSNAELSLLFSFFGGILVLICLILLLKDLFKENENLQLLLPLLFYSTPMVFFQAAKDLKMDSYLTFISIGIIAILIHLISTKEKGYLLSILLGLFLGIAFTTKFTIVFLVIPVLFFFIWKKFRISGLILGITSLFLFTWENHGLIGQYFDLSNVFNQIPISFFWIILVLTSGGVIYIGNRNKNGITSIILLAFFGFITVSPWMIKNGYDSNSFKINSLLAGTSNGPSINLSISNEKFLGTKIDSNTVNDISKEEISLSPNEPVSIGSSHKEEVQRYAGYYEDIFNKYLFKPWQIHKNSLAQGFYVDIGFIWLVVLGLFIPVSLMYKTKNELIIFSAITTTYWIIWIVLAQGIIWYGMPGFILLLILFGKWYEREESRIIKKLFIFFSIFWILTTTFTRFNNFNNPYTIVYGSNYLSGEQVLDQIMTSFRNASKIINDNKPTNDHPNYIYRIGTFIPYMIENDFSRIFNDAQLDQFTYLNSEENYYLTTARLGASGVRYIVIDLNTATIDRTPEKTLTQKYQRLVKYLTESQGKYITPLIFDQNVGLALVEINEEFRDLYSN